MAPLNVTEMTLRPKIYAVSPFEKIVQTFHLVISLAIRKQHAILEMADMDQSI